MQPLFQGGRLRAGVELAAAGEEEALARYVQQTLAAFAEVAKKVQMETVELMLAAGKDFSEDATSAVKKATNEVTTAARKIAQISFLLMTCSSHSDK